MVASIPKGSVLPLNFIFWGEKVSKRYCATSAYFGGLYGFQKSMYWIHLMRYRRASKPRRTAILVAQDVWYWNCCGTSVLHYPPVQLWLLSSVPPISIAHTNYIHSYYACRWNNYWKGVSWPTWSMEGIRNTFYPSASVPLWFDENVSVT